MLKVNPLVERVARAIEPETFLLPQINMNYRAYEIAFEKALRAIAAMKAES